ncbi:class I SAM-dependent methyltransferase [Edaphobacillus lindanitolerans]|uniref:Methyltransferase domain-containing protein n=1 Tax=Edaphobacillus lindanitolerans TaxID=550447 RepID=A0A1U7PSY1_9BACI|nr:class I SAM-dependent methyltransferase [Edaphobacillus lindanitolerans]SIT91151.1 Methyltransferase domain-containing protein [Edaphobacillus lindanitolerans]
MNHQSGINKKAWEYRAYEFWEKRDGTPREKAGKILEDPKGSLKKHRHYFEEINGLKVANVCGSNGRKAVPLSVLGAEVTVFDISEENRKYALELAECANTSIDYVVGDIYDLNVDRYREGFDVLYLEGGVLHYFHDIERFMGILFSILQPGGRMILSDYHPFGRCIGADSTYQPVYFDGTLRQGDVAYKQFFDEDEQPDFPDVSIRHFTLSEILNAVIRSGFKIEEFTKHRGWTGENLPWEFTVLASK